MTGWCMSVGKGGGDGCGWRPELMMDGVIEQAVGTAIDASVIWLHGLGADGNDFVPVIPALGLGECGIRFLFPHAPVRPVTVNGGLPMRAWYDILAMGAERKVNEAQLVEAADAVWALIEREQQRGVASERIVLVGFSQGGAVAYHCALRATEPLAGLAALSTYRVAPQRYPASPQQRGLAVFCAHGGYDEVVPRALGRQGWQSLCDEGLAPEWQEYPMGHEVCLAEIEALGAWIGRRLALG